MFSLTDGRPIAKSDNSRGKKVVLGIIDPDADDSESESCFGCGECCDNCDQELCQDEPCCNNCKIFYESESFSSSEEERPRKVGGKLLGKDYRPPTGIKLIPLPDLTERFVDYVAGPSGSGKSTIAGGLAHEFKALFPKKPIYIFSRTDANKDPAYAKLKPIQISIDETLLEDPMDITQEITEGGALIIFDDCNTIPNDKLRKEVEKLMADAMEVGRKLNCNMIITSHLVVPNEKKLARTILNEMHTLTVFPKSGSSQQIKYALKTYFGMNNKQIEKVLDTKSRWVRISKSYPQYVLSSGGAYIT